jgi:hypothetical protein
MNGLPFQAAATGNVGPARGGTIIGAVLTATSDTATATIREGGSGGTIKLVLSAPTLQTAGPFIGGMVLSGQVHATLTGTSPSLTLVFAD